MDQAIQAGQNARYARIVENCTSAEDNLSRQLPEKTRYNPESAMFESQRSQRQETERLPVS